MKPLRHVKGKGYKLEQQEGTHKATKTLFKTLSYVTHGKFVKALQIEPLQHELYFVNFLLWKGGIQL